MYAGNFAIPYDTLDIALRLIAATVIGMGLGLERLLRGKPTGIRTLGLVAFAAALVTLALTHAAMVPGNAEAVSRVLQGAVQGILVGIGFLGGGVILRTTTDVHNLTTAAEVWATAGIGLAAAVAPWAVVILAVVIFVTLIILFRVLEKKFDLKS